MKKTTRDMVLGIIMACAGFLAAVPLGATALVMILHELPLGFRVLPVALFSLLFVLTILASILAATGLRMYRRAGRFRRYWSLIRTKGFCDVSVLADAVEKKPRFVARDLTRMLNAGLLPGGHLDDDKTCLIVGDALYQQYRAVRDNRTQKPLRSENDDVISSGLEAVRQIRAANAALPGVAITEKLLRLEDVTTGIFAYVEQRPAKLPEIRRFMDYYLPTTIKLVKSYQDFAQQPETPSSATAMEEILATLDTISTAFETLLDGLYQDDAMDISTDISVLKTMLAQEGLTGNDFDMNRSNDHE